MLAKIKRYVNNEYNAIREQCHNRLVSLLALRAVARGPSASEVLLELLPQMPNATELALTPNAPIRCLTLSFQSCSNQLPAGFKVGSNPWRRRCGNNDIPTQRGSHCPVAAISFNFQGG
ncbi:hypothetical protein GQX74_003033 [Glossina fuscipes]|nr:hypothetical protein GQX74_003033 [Glossina fuscipes]